MEEKKLFLLDAYALIYRAYYAFIRAPRINSKGVNTSAIFGFVNSLEEVLKKENPTHIAVCFDPSGPTFRHELFENYKAQREETPEVIRASIPVIKEIIKAYNIPIIEVKGYEADDVIGTLAKKAEKNGFTTYMMTPDKDYGQLVDTHTFMYKPRTMAAGFDILGIEEITKKYEIENVSQVIDLLGLMGDAADNIPGCPGVGAKTAQKLIAEFGSIENIIANVDSLKGALKTKVENNVQQILDSKFLATIKTDVPVEFDEKSLKRDPLNEEDLSKIFQDLEFRQLSDRILKNNLKIPQTVPIQGDLFSKFTEESTEIEKYSNLENLKSVDNKYYLVDNQEKIDDLILKLSFQNFWAFDTESTSIDPIKGEIVGISFALEENEAFYIPLPADKQEVEKILSKFKGVFENEQILKIGQNIKYDYIILKKYGIDIKGKMFDTMIAHYLIQPEQRHNLDYLAEIYLKYDTIKIEELIGSGKNQLNMRQIAPEKVYEYACEDADVTLRLKNILEKELKKDNLENLFYNIEMPLVPVLADMEIEGVKIDTNALKDTSVILTKKMQEVEKEIHQITGIEFNISSPKVVGEILFEKLNLDEKAKKTKTGQYSTSEEVLEKLKDKHPAVELILEYRGLKKLLSTYVDALPALINSNSGKIHTSFNQAVTATGRLSSSNPNLQNIPVRTDVGRELRKAFIPDKGCSFFSADYSQIELRIMAELSRDENMLEAFRSGNDIHSATAAKIYKIPIEEVTSDMRRKAKTANFGIIYGISTFGLANRLNIPRGEAKELIDGYFETYPGVKKYMDKSIEIARQNGYVETLFGRKRMLPDINSKNSVVRSFAERNAINAPIQGSAADIIKIAMINIAKRFKENKIKSTMILQVHDELNFNVIENEKQKVKDIVIEEMQKAYKMSIPLIADCGFGANWLEAH
ncbi:MAG: DNA polymerase I [Bacteroidales bacterium]|nr:DNA polymerase I [Bacteroidales bacterium]